MKLTFGTRSITPDTLAVRISTTTGTTVPDTGALVGHQMTCNQRHSQRTYTPVQVITGLDNKAGWAEFTGRTVYLVA